MRSSEVIAQDMKQQRKGDRDIAVPFGMCGGIDFPALEVPGET
jgi:hypothetical protein